MRLSGHYPLRGTPLVVSGGGVDLTLEGFGAEGATIDAEGMSRAIEVAAGASLTLRGVHVVNGSALSGGGLLVQGAGSSLLLERSSIRDSVATGAFPDGGGGLCVQQGASAMLLDSAIADCECPNSGSGGGAYAYEKANLTLRGSRVERCRAFYGGGVSTYRFCHADILEGSVLSKCHAIQYSGGLHCLPVKRQRRRLATRPRERAMSCSPCAQRGRGQRHRGAEICKWHA